MACSVGSDGGMKSSNYVALVSFCRFSNFTGVKAKGRIKTCSDLILFKLDTEPRSRTLSNSVGFSILFMSPGEVWFFLRTLRTKTLASSACMKHQLDEKYFSCANNVPLHIMRKNRRKEDKQINYSSHAPAYVTGWK
jgi:hypothetical protein